MTYEECAAILCATLEIVHAGLDDLGVNVELEARLVENVLLDRVLANEAVHAHFALLTDAVSTVLRLEVHLRVPVAIKDDDRVGRLQVQSETAGTSAQDEHIEILRLVELLQ